MWICRRWWPSEALVSLLLAGVLLVGCGEHSENIAGRPNVLIVIVDDLASGAVGALGGDPRITPHIDRLAAESVVFENAVVATPLCTPSRSAFLTGRWPHEIGVTQPESSGRDPAPGNAEDIGGARCPGMSDAPFVQFRCCPTLCREPDKTLAQDAWIYQAPATLLRVGREDRAPLICPMRHWTPDGRAAT